MQDREGGLGTAALGTGAKQKLRLSLENVDACVMHPEQDPNRDLEF